MERGGRREDWIFGGRRRRYGNRGGGGGMGCSAQIERKRGMFVFHFYQHNVHTEQPASIHVCTQSETCLNFRSSAKTASDIKQSSHEGQHVCHLSSQSHFHKAFTCFQKICIITGFVHNCSNTLAGKHHACSFFKLWL